MKWLQEIDWVPGVQSATWHRFLKGLILISWVIFSAPTKTSFVTEYPISEN
jgi:hypothetical protein